VVHRLGGELLDRGSREKAKVYKKKYEGKLDYHKRKKDCNDYRNPDMHVYVLFLFHEKNGGRGYAGVVWIRMSLKSKVLTLLQSCQTYIS
jgi:hypothetical protein